jgi:hypothetical protein
MTSVEAQCVELAKDADKWLAGADRMNGAAHTAGGLGMSAEQFGAIADEHGVVSAYVTLQQQLTNLLTGATTAFGTVGDTVTLVAQTYLEEDQAGAHAMRRIEDRL